MSYTEFNYKTKKELVEDFKKGLHIRVFEPGIITGDAVNGIVYLEGPHFPEAHTWYASGECRDGRLVELNEPETLGQKI